jgi:hypothetical protein
MKTIIHVDQHVIKRNRKHGTNEPPLTLRTYKGTRKAHEIVVKGEVKFVHSPHKPLSCGARVWVETQSPVEVVA